MKGLAIYTIIIFGLIIAACLATETTFVQWLGVLMMLPILAFAILYLVKDNKGKNRILPIPYTQPLKSCANCHKECLPASSYCGFCGTILS
jgi:hypothetical protein